MEIGYAFRSVNLPILFIPNETTLTTPLPHLPKEEQASFQLLNRNGWHAE